MPVCSQCGRPAIFERAGHPLCVDCNLKFEQAVQMRDRLLKQQINFLLDQADAVTGIHTGFGRYDLSEPIVHQGPMTFHTINVSRSVVGAINTGTVRQMEVALNHIHIANGNAELETALKAFAEEVLAEAALTINAKNEILQQLTALTEEIAKPNDSRIMGVIKAFIGSIAANIASTSLVTHWQNIRHMLGL